MYLNPNLPFQCIHDIDLIFSCFFSEGHLRLVNGDNITTLEGILEIYHDHLYGGICDDGFDDSDAQVKYFFDKSFS